MVQPKKTRPLNAWMIALINISAMCNIKNFPLLAEYGVSIMFFLALASVFFFIPAAFISAELASTWPEKGVYTWVKKGLGDRMGFLAIWLQWIENVIWYPTVLSFIAATFAYVIHPDLALNKFYILSLILPIFWLTTLVNFFGMKVSGWISSTAALMGTLIPIAFIIFLGAIWIVGGHPLAVSFSFKNFFPCFHSIHDWVLLSGILLGLSGIEMSAVHAKDVVDPSKAYPRGILLSALLILLFSTLGSLAISSVVPQNNIQLASGAMEAFCFFLKAFHISWLLPILALITTFGALGMMSTWIIGPSRGLLATAEDGDLPPFFHKVNRHGMPVTILITQACIVTVLSLVFLLMPSINSSYWVLVALASILYQIMYILMFIAAIRLRQKFPQTERPYTVPFGRLGLWILSIIGIIGSSFGLFCAFFPPTHINTGKIAIFECILIGGTLLLCGLPILIFYLRKPSWKKKMTYL